LAPITVNSSVRTREYLTTAEIERLMAAARESSRYGHRDATMILIGYRHGLRASELCDLQWSQVELATGRLHVRRAKNGSPSVHPMQGDEIRSDRGSGQNAIPDTSAHAAAWLRLCPSQCRPRHTGATGLARPQEHPAYRSIYRTFSRTVPRFLEGLGRGTHWRR